MKIQRFSAVKVHGIYNFDTVFLPGINFLIGINGSGKTTILRLIQAMLSMDLVTLHAIRFSKLSLQIERNNSNVQMTIENEGASLAVSFKGGIEAEARIRFLSDEERDLFLKSDRLDENLEEARLVFLRTLDESARSLLDGERPLFLGLERRAERYDEEPGYSASTLRAKRFLNGVKRRHDSLDGLDNCEMLIERAYRQYRRVSDSVNSRVVNVLIASTFDYREFDRDSWVLDDENSMLELEALLFRRSELERFAFSFSEGPQFGETVERFFGKIQALVDQGTANRDETEFTIELLMNRVQIQRFQQVFAELDKHKKHSERAFAPIKSFVDSMNRFFATSRKSVEVDRIGRLRILREGEPVPLQALSSGEKQLIILVANATFSKNKGGVFIIDEPELSLHLRWQEMLIEELTLGNKNNQFIFATHSPEIVGYLASNCVQVG